MEPHDRGRYTEDLQAMVGSEDISQELGRYETVLWSGRPAQGVRWRDEDAVVVLVGLVFLGGTIGGIVAMLRDGLPIYATLFFLPHSLGGVYLLAGRFFVDSFLRRHTHYFVTHRRALILRLWPGRSVQSVELRQLESIQRVVHSDGTVTIVLGKRRRRHAPPCLQSIQDAEHVCQLILDASDEDEEEDG